MEINSKERDSFWQKEQEKEKQRYVAEAEKKNLINQQLVLKEINIQFLFSIIRYIFSDKE